MAVSNGFYVVMDRKTGARVNRRMFRDFYALRPAMPCDGKELVVAPTLERTGTAFRRIAVPELKVTERVDVPFVGTFLQYGKKLVGIGRDFEVSYRDTPSVILLDQKLSIDKRSTIDESKEWGNASCGFSAATIHGRYLIYGADCGGVQQLVQLSTGK